VLLFPAAGLRVVCVIWCFVCWKRAGILPVVLLTLRLRQRHLPRGSWGALRFQADETSGALRFQADEMEETIACVEREGGATVSVNLYYVLLCMYELECAAHIVLVVRCCCCE
jgi:hypothetical protein